MMNFTHSACMTLVEEDNDGGFPTQTCIHARASSRSNAFSYQVSGETNELCVCMHNDERKKKMDVIQA